MENAVDALKLGAAVLIFVLALSVSVTAFSEARIASSTLLDYRDREFWLGSSDYWYSEASNQTRTVGKESIIPSIYRAKTEKFKIVFDFKNDYYLFTKKIEGVDKPINIIELETLESYGDSFINIVLYGKDKSGVDTDIINGIERAKGITFRTSEDCLFKKINNKQFQELPGEFYPSEATAGKSKVPESNREKKREITYKEI